MNPITTEIEKGLLNPTMSVADRAIAEITKQVAEKGITVHKRPDRLHVGNDVQGSSLDIITSEYGFTVPVGVARLETIFAGERLGQLEKYNELLNQFSGCTLRYVKEEAIEVCFGNCTTPILVHFPIRNPVLPDSIPKEKKIQYEVIPQEVKSIIAALMVIDNQQFHATNPEKSEVDIYEEVRNRGISLATRNEGSLHPNVFGFPEAILRSFGLTDVQLGKLGIKPPLKDHNRLYCITTHHLKDVLTIEQLAQFYPVSIIEKKSSPFSLYND